MTDLLAARSQMAGSLAFHIVFACVGMAMPLLMVVAEGLWLRTGRDVYRELAYRWSKGTAILFVVGAVSGTVLSFELGLLWPEFMRFAGPIIGMPFSLEGFAFFLEAIFLGIYLYGWDRVRPVAHWLAGVAVWVSGTLSGVFVVFANGWMNQPTGFTMVDGVVVDVDPVAAFLNPAGPTQALHMTLAAFASVGFAVAGIHAWQLLRGGANAFHLRALQIALGVGAVAALLQPLSGHHIAQHVAEHQPLKLAAAEALWDTQAGAPFTIGGWPVDGRTVGAVEIPYMLSLLAFDDPNATVQGLDDFDPELHPPVAVVHLAYQVMLGAGVAMGALSAFTVAFALVRRRLPDHPWFLRAVVACAPLGFVAVEAGWIVTEVGRQPWVVYGVLKTEDAVTPMPGLVAPFLLFSALYVFLAWVVFVLMRRQVFASPRMDG